MIFNKNAMIESSASLSDIRCVIIILLLWKQIENRLYCVILARAKWEPVHLEWSEQRRE